MGGDDRAVFYDLSSRRVKVCFYAAVNDPALFEIVEFYRQDVRALRNLGHQVRLARSPREIGRDWDVAWVWWQTSGVPAMVAARARRKPSVLVTALSDNDRSASGIGVKSPAALVAGRLSLAIADLVLPTSEDTRLGLEGYRTRRLRTAPLGIDTTQYQPVTGPAAPDRPFVLTISHLTQDNVSRKRILDVVRTAAHVPGVPFVVVGGHAEGAEVVKAEIERLGLSDRVQLRGRVSAEEKLRLLQTAGVYFQPTEYEAFGVAIAEAMACGTPVVSSAVGNVPALVGDAGILTPASGSPQTLAHAVQTVLEHDDNRALGDRARRRIVEHYSSAMRERAVEAALSCVT